RFMKSTESPLAPLKQNLARFDKLAKEFDAVRDKLYQGLGQEKGPKLRALVRESLTTSALVEGTRFQKELPRHWAAWEKLTPRQITERLRALAEEHRKLLKVESELELKEKQLEQADQRRLEEVRFELDLGRLERLLRQYENQSGKNEGDPGGRQQ